MKRPCDECDTEKQSTKSFRLFGEHEPNGIEARDLCFECRWPYIRTRVWGPDATGQPGNVQETDETSPTSGQTGIADYL